jgi:hypothetical protein
VGSRLKLTPELQTRICDLLRLSGRVDASAVAVGISRDTFYLWMKKGREQSSGVYHDFVEAVEQAQAEGETECVKIIRKAAARDWHAAITLLERRHPKQWGKRTFVDIDAARVEKALERVRARVPAAAYDALLQALADDEGEGDPHQ